MLDVERNTFADAKILLVDDEQDILDILSYNLKKEGYQVHTCMNGIQATQQAKIIKPQVIILDIMMPEMDGVEACKNLKEIPELRDSMIAFLTARSEEYSEIACLEAGADDFIRKPVRPRLFLTHVKALLRRYYLSTTPETPQIIKVGDLTVNPETYKVQRNNKDIYLTKKEFSLLSLLISKPQKVFLRNEIYSKVWGYDILVGERTIDVHISKLREKIGKDYIITIKKVGYKFM